MESKLWKELLFLLLPFIVFIAFSLMVGCGRVSLGDGAKIDPYHDLRLSAEEQQNLEQEKSVR